MDKESAEVKKCRCGESNSIEHTDYIIGFTKEQLQKIEFIKAMAGLENVASTLAFAYQEIYKLYQWQLQGGRFGLLMPGDYIDSPRHYKLPIRQ